MGAKAFWTDTEQFEKFSPIKYIPNLRITSERPPIHQQQHFAISLHNLVTFKFSVAIPLGYQGILKGKGSTTGCTLVRYDT